MAKLSAIHKRQQYLKPFCIEWCELEIKRIEVDELKGQPYDYAYANALNAVIELTQLIIHLENEEIRNQLPDVVGEG